MVPAVINASDGISGWRFSSNLPGFSVRRTNNFFRPRYLGLRFGTKTNVPCCGIETSGDSKVVKHARRVIRKIRITSTLKAIAGKSQRAQMRTAALKFRPRASTNAVHRSDRRMSDHRDSAGSTWRQEPSGSAEIDAPDPQRVSFEW